MYGVKKNLAEMGIKCTFIDTDIHRIQITTENAGITIYPSYIRGENWDADFKEVENYILENGGDNAIIIGDLNIRIGEMQQTVDDVVQNCCLSYIGERKSSDKIHNDKGKKFLSFCDDHGFIIANGVTKGDEEGCLTFISGSGQSVNDICAVSVDVFPYVDRFSVDDRTWSDHFPICLSLKLNVQKNAKKTEKLLPKLQWCDKQKVKYNEDVKSQIHHMKENNTEINLNAITCVIKNSVQQNGKSNKTFVPKNPWFDWKCNNARKNSFKLLKKYKESQDVLSKRKYLQANVIYKKICEESKIKYYKQLELKLNAVNDSKSWWKIAKEIRNQEFNQMASVSSEEFRSYFMTLLNPLQMANELSYAPMLKEDFFLDSEITTSEIRFILNKAKLNKAPGEDRVPYEFFKNAPVELLNELAKNYNILYNNTEADDTFFLSVIYPIFKKGNPNLASNYRGISFMNCVAKIMMGILNERLYAWSERNSIITEYQAGFRKGYSTVDNIYNLAAIVNIKLNQKKKVYAFFIDFKAAFDKVSRKSLMYKLHALGVSTKMVYFLEKIYSTTQSTVWNGTELSEPFETIAGLKQGCLMSPLLFSLYINDLHEHLGGGIFIDDLNIRLLLYADDIVLLAEDIEVLQKMIKKLENYCELWSLEVNLTKSKIMVYRNGGKTSKNEKWYFKEEEIEIVNEYNYLGMILTPKMVFTKHVQKRLNAAKSSINATWSSFLNKPDICIKTKYHIFSAVSRAIQSYGAQVWGHTHFEEVDKLQRYFIKRILKLPNSTPNYALMLESGLEDCHLFTLNLNLSYLKRTIFEFPEARLPHKLSLKILENKIFWAKSINELSNIFNVQWQPGMTLQEWEEKQYYVINSLKIKYYEERWLRAAQSETFYGNLNFTKGQYYFMDVINQNKVMWIFKARCDLIKLNGSRFTKNSSKLCSLCNMKEIENIQHFICRCPILNNFRSQQFGCITISEEDLVKILDGELYTWQNLVNYIINAYNYRKLLINEYNC